jgi:hypothetical protein
MRDTEYTDSSSSAIYIYMYYCYWCTVVLTWAAKNTLLKNSSATSSMPTHICCLLHMFWGSFSISVKKPIFGKNLLDTVVRVHSNAKTPDIRLMLMYIVLIAPMYTMSACNAVTQSVVCWYAMVYRCGKSSARAEQQLAYYSIDAFSMQHSDNTKPRV